MKSATGRSQYSLHPDGGVRAQGRLAPPGTASRTRACSPVAALLPVWRAGHQRAGWPCALGACTGAALLPAGVGIEAPAESGAALLHAVCRHIDQHAGGARVAARLAAGAALGSFAAAALCKRRVPLSEVGWLRPAALCSLVLLFPHLPAPLACGTGLHDTTKAVSGGASGAGGVAVQKRSGLVQTCLDEPSAIINDCVVGTRAGWSATWRQSGTCNRLPLAAAAAEATSPARTHLPLPPRSKARPGRRSRWRSAVAAAGGPHRRRRRPRAGAPCAEVVCAWLARAVDQAEQDWPWPGTRPSSALPRLRATAARRCVRAGTWLRGLHTPCTLPAIALLFAVAAVAAGPCEVVSLPSGAAGDEQRGQQAAAGGGGW